MVGDVTIEWELPSGGLYIMPSRHGAAAAFPGPGENNFRLVCPARPPPAPVRVPRAHV